MNIISYNICDTGKANKRKSLRDLLSKYRVNFLALQETFLSSRNLLKLRSIWGNYHFEFEEVLSNGHSGGIVSMWDPAVFHKEMVVGSNNFLIVGGRWIQVDLQCFVINLYAPQSEQDKCKVWHDILRFKEINSGNYIVLGDFNSVRSQAERFGSTFSAVNAGHFNDFIINGGFIDVPLGGNAFTRFSSNCLKATKLDRFLVTFGILDVVKDVEGLVVDGIYSDHRPIILSQNYRDFGPSLFKLFNSWMDQPGFEELVRHHWNFSSGVISSNTGRKFATRLKSLKYAIKGCRKLQSHSSIVSDTLRHQLKSVEQQILSGLQSQEAANLRSSLVLELNNQESVINRDLFRKAKVKWGVEGEENTKYFHNIVNWRRRILTIREVKVDGRWVDSPNGIKSCFFNHFSSKFRKFEGLDFSLDQVLFRQISGPQQDMLESPVSLEEIRRAVWDCGVDKSPGPDGFCNNCDFDHLTTCTM